MPQSITPDAARRLIDEGATLIDVRDPDEHARERIPGAVNVPMARIGEVPSGPLVFHCRSGMRTGANAATLAAAAKDAPCHLLDGGIEAWRAAGLPVHRDARAPLEIMRQVQIVAGSLVLVGVLLGLFVAPGFLALSAFVGAGLAFAGISGWCGMAKLLGAMPWNRGAATA